MELEKILPPRLSRDKAIGIIAPADPVVGVCSEKTIQRGYAYLQGKGFTVVEGKSIKEKATRHTAGSVADRLNDIHEFVQRDDVGCIMAYWGGFNCNQLLDQLDFDLIKKHPKIFIGYSDVAALTSSITTKTGLVTFSGPGFISFAKPDPYKYTWEYFEKMCITPSERLQIKASPNYSDDLFFLRPDDDHRVIKDNQGVAVFNGGRASGEIVAGNLQTLLVLTGTQYQPDVRGKILFVEEDETSTPAHFDRFLTQCKQMGWFDQIAGLILGRFAEQSGFSKTDSLEDLLNQYFSGVRFPVMYNADFGHTDPLITIPNGGIAEIDTKDKAIVFHQAVK